MAKALANSTSKSTKPETKVRTFVLDTSVLLSDPKAMFRFSEHEVVLPITVINELEKKRHDPEIGYFARQTLRYLDDLRSEHERLDFPIQVGDGGTSAHDDNARTGSAQARVATPSTCTVQQPHCVVSQPTCVPVRR